MSSEPKVHMKAIRCIHHTQNHKHISTHLQPPPPTQERWNKRVRKLREEWNKIGNSREMEQNSEATQGGMEQNSGRSELLPICVTRCGCLLTCKISSFSCEELQVALWESTLSRALAKCSGVRPFLSTDFTSVPATSHTQLQPLIKIITRTDEVSCRNKWCNSAPVQAKMSVL